MADLTANGIVPFSQFVESLHEARAAHFLNVPNSALEDEVSFAEMRSYLERYYDGAEAIHSFVDEGDSIFDCIPIEQQFSRRGKTDRIPAAPDLAEVLGRSESEAEMPMQSITQWRPGVVDRFGNAAHAPEGTIPVRRMTLTNLARFRSLREFHQKYPSPAGGLTPPRAGPRPGLRVDTKTHRWAAGWEIAGSVGGSANHNVWAPPVGAGQDFSLSQQWYAGGKVPDWQTAEVGWHVFPNRYGHSKPTLFIYWTADNYATTGCYNLDCSGFVQTNPKWVLGGSLSPVSTSGGPQYGIKLAFWKTSGGWWLYAGGDSVGLYPLSIYGAGTMATNAWQIQYGGEVSGTTSFPPMGSGAFAGAGWQYAAYQSQLTYFHVDGGSGDPSLKPLMDTPGCYTESVVKYAPPWNTTIWFGGPGGTTC